MKYFSLLFFAFVFNPTYGQATKDIVEQSPYYDAMELYYTLHGFKVYPILYSSENIQTTVTDSAEADSPVSPQPANTDKLTTNKKKKKPAVAGTGATTKSITGTRYWYRLVECGTGRVMRDSCSNEHLMDSLKQFLFPADHSEDNIMNEIVETILARNYPFPLQPGETVRNVYDSNAYLKEILDPAQRAKNLGAMIIEGIDGVSSHEGGAASFTTGITAYTDWVIKMVNQEINDAFFVQLRNVLDNFAELRVLLPQSYASFQEIEITRISSALNVLKIAFANDLNNLLGNISKLSTLDKYKTLVQHHPELVLLFTATDMAHLISQNTEPAVVLNTVAHAAYVDAAGRSIYPAVIKTANLLSLGLLDKSLEKRSDLKVSWIGGKQLKIFSRNTALFQIFMGLITQRAADIHFSANDASLNLRTILNTNKDKIIQGKYIVYNFTNSANQVRDAFNALSLLSGKIDSDFVYASVAVMRSLTGFAETFLQVLPNGAVYQQVKKITDATQQQYLPIAQQTGYIFLLLQKKEYSQVVHSTAELINQLLKTYNADPKVILAVNNIAPVNRSLTANEKKHNNEIVMKDISYNDQLKKHILYYGAFITGIAEAKDGKEVQDVIAAFALPKGSSRIKKVNRFTFGLNGYAGIYQGWYKKYDGIDIKRSQTNITSPVGFAASWGNFLSGSLTLYGGVIDVGAIFSYRMNNDSTDIKSELRFGQILSPSVSLIYGLPVTSKNFNIPLSVGASFQWGPRLRKIDNESGNTLIPLLARRFQLFAAVDLPIFNFHVRKKNE